MAWTVVILTYGVRIWPRSISGMEKQLIWSKTIKSESYLSQLRFVAATGVFLFITLSAYAQGPSPSPAPPPPDQAGGTGETERVIVTGSNIPTAEEVGPNPVLNINRDLINKSPQRSAEALIKELPVANANGVPLSNNNTGFTPGASSISLRGFDPSATLVLLDGRRLAPYPVGTGGTFTFIDLNSIPRAAIESIEILKDGASTTYGADAVAGVVNIKLYKQYRGAVASVEYGNTLDKDSSQFDADILFGIGDDKTQVTGVINYYHRNSIFARDRANSSFPPFRSSNASPYNLQVSFDSVVGAGGTPPPGTGPGDIFFAHAPFFTNGLAPASAYTYTTAAFPVRFNFGPLQGMFPSSERWGGYNSFEHKVCGDQLVLYGDMLYQNVKTHNEIAPGATGSFETPGQQTIAIPPNHPLPGGVTPPNTPTFSETGLPVGAFNPFNPFEQIIAGATRARLAEFGNRKQDNETDSFVSTVGIKGDKLFDGTWGYDAGFRYSQVKDTTNFQTVSATRFRRVLNAADPIFDPTSSEFIGTTIPFDPFGDFRVPIPSNAGSVNFATIRAHDIENSKLAELDLNIYSTELFKLPAGGVGLAFGGQFRRETITQNPDDAALAGDLIGEVASALTHAGRKDYAFYAETTVPIFGPEQAVPGFHSLEFTAAGRFEAFENNDTNVLVPKVGLRWQPFDEQLTIRSTWGEGFREPSLFELYASPTSFLTPTVFHGNTNPDTNGIETSNPNLQPEDSRTFSGGVVYTPKYVPGLTLSVDLWDIERKGVVAAPVLQEVLQRFETGHLLPGEMVELDPTGTIISRVTETFQNAGRQNARGVDMGIQYTMQTPYGTFTSLTQATYLDSFILQVTTQSKSAEVSGGSADQGTLGDGYLKWKGISRLDWAWKGFDLIGTARYFGGFNEHLFSGAPNPPNPEGNKDHYVHATWFIDGQASYNLAFTAPVESQPVAGYSKDAKEVVRGKDGKAVETGQTANYSMPCWKNILNNTTITIGCDNIFGEDPPEQFGINAASNANDFPGAIYDNVGRFVYVELTKKF
jgi:iron complex outermembrane receptor protein